MTEPDATPAELEAERRRFAFLQEASVVLASSLDYTETLERVARLAVPTLADYCVIDVLDESDTVCRVAAHADPAKEPLVQQLRSLPPSARLMERMGRVIVTGEPDVVSELDAARTAAAIPDAARQALISALGPRSYMVVALRAHGRTFGTLTFVFAESGRSYHRSDVNLAQELARRAAMAIENARLHEAERRARREAEASANLVRRVQTITDAALGDLSLDPLLEEVLRRVQQALHANTATVLLYDPEDDALRARVALGLEAEVKAQVRVPVGRGFAGRIAATRRPLVLDEVDHADVVSRYIREQGLRSLAGVPLISQSRLVGVLHVGSTRPRAFTADDVELLVLAAARIAVALERVAAHEAERRARVVAEEAERRAAFLAEASSVLGSSLDYQQTLRALAHLVVPTLADWCSVDVVDPDGQIRRLAIAHADASKADIARAAAIYPADPDARHPRTQVLRSGRSVLIGDVTDDGLQRIATDEEHLRGLRALGYRSGMIVPLAARGHVLGALTLATAESGRRYGAADLAFAEDLASRAALAVDNARLYQDAQEANRLKDQFLTTVSHELRTPLTAMMNWVAVLRQGKVTPERAARAIEVIRRAGAAQAKLIDDILDASRAVTGRLRLDLRPVDLLRIVEDAVDAVRPAAEAKSVRVDTALDASLAPVAADPERIQQVVWNLVSNAVKFTPDSGRVTVRLERTTRDVRLVVADTGEGIERDFLPFVFEPFRQAEHAESRRHGGLGLGLAIVKYLVEAHGGRVEARSDGKGKGAQFTVSLPLAPLAPPSTGESASG